VWKRAWDRLGSGDALYARLASDRALRRRYDLHGAFPYFAMLEKQHAGEVDSWGVGWYTDVFANGGIVLYPRKSQVANRGHDGSGTHGEASSPFESDAHAVAVTQLPPARLDEVVVRAFERYLKRAHRSERLARVVGRLRGMGTHVARLRDILPGGHGRTSLSQEGEDLILARIFEHQATGIYVDVGAHHPRRFSNTHLLYQRGWRGVNIDATPGSMEAFRRARPRDVNLEMGVAGTDETRTFYLYDEPALNTFDPARAKALEATPYKLRERREVRCAPLRAILAEHGIGPIDLLTVDVEGFDFEVLKTLDWEVSRPRVVVTEQFSRDLAALMTSELHAFMQARRYQIVAKTFNSVFYLRAD
jgi:FkbM family methyltransferase